MFAHHTPRLIRPWRCGLVALLLLGLARAALPTPAPVAAASFGIAPDRASGQPSGTTVTWTATPADSAAREYRFSVAHNGGAPAIVRDFAEGATVTWTPLDEGTYQITVEARARGDSGAPDETVRVAYTVASRIIAGQPVVSATAHPLVALYSIPPCGTGVVRVSFAAGANPAGGQQTPAVACSPVASTNLYLVGLRPSTTYAIQYTVTDGTTTSVGPVARWTSGALPADVTFPAIGAPVAPTADSDTAAGIVYQAPLALGADTTQAQLYATDLAGNVLWYLPYDSNISVGAARPIPGGDTLAIVDGPGEHLIRILDPVGNPMRETSLTRLNEQLAALPQPTGRTLEPLRALHHEINLLPNGHIAVLGFTERLFPAGTQGSTTGLPVDLVGDEIVILDPNLHVDWAWNAFDHLDIGRRALLEEDCVPPGCAAPLRYAAQAGGTAQDWLHSNAVSYSPTDGNLLLSIRHQDWILKLDYRDGQGNGDVLWRLGHDGDFTLTNAPADEPFPWFSHQHGIELTPDGRLLTLDNGNTRCDGQGADCHSRGQVYQLDEANRRATRIVDADLGDYSAALGWAQLLPNGNLSFVSGFQQDQAPAFGQTEEFDPSGVALLSVVESRPAQLYRAYRLTTMYDGCCAPLVAYGMPVPNNGAATPLTLAVDGPGTVERDRPGPGPGPYAYPAGTLVALTPRPALGALFLGWEVDGAARGSAAVLTITVDRAHRVTARFVAAPSFADLADASPAARLAVAQLAARGIAQGCDPVTARFCPVDDALRAQMAALLVRAMGWGGERTPTPFSDRGGVDDELWADIGILASHGVARGYGDGTFDTLGPVLNVQTIAFVARAMVAQGRWQEQPDDPALYPNVPASTGHRQDLATYVHYAGPVRGTATATSDFPAWDQPASRAWFAYVLWRALASDLGTDQPGSGGYVP